MRMRGTPAVYVLSLTAAAALGIGVWAGTAGAVSHVPRVSHAGTRPAIGSGMYPRDCAGTCFSLYSRKLGIGRTMNAHIPGDTGTGGRTGRKINVRLARNSRPNENFVPSAIGRVSQFCGADPHDYFPATSYACTHYPDFWVFEAQWSPFGNESGLCAGVAVAGRGGENVTLQPCGASARTLWIGDRANGLGGDCRYPGNYCPWVNGGAADSAHPLALTVDTSTVVPADQLKVERLLLTGAGGNQEFAYFWGPVA
jgi:hypothetical protein